jgi:hypothetical protein
MMIWSELVSVIDVFGERKRKKKEREEGNKQYRGSTPPEGATPEEATSTDG